MSLLIGIAMGVASALVHNAWVSATVKRHLAGAGNGWGASGRVLTIAGLLFAAAAVSRGAVAVALLSFAATRMALTLREARR